FWSVTRRRLSGSSGTGSSTVRGRGCRRVRGRRRMPDDVWLPDPPDGIYVAGGFDGSDNDDFTCIKLETREGYVFTPRYGPDRRPTIWNPAEWGGRIPRSEVHVAWEELARRYRLVRVYCTRGSVMSRRGRRRLARGIRPTGRRCSFRGRCPVGPA